MQKFHWERPPYAIASVDNALRLLHMLRDEGPVKLVDAATHLGVATSTAHRILAMLVYRGFAVQLGSYGHYAPGPALGAAPVRGDALRGLKELLQPYLESITAELGHTSNLFVRVGTSVRTIATVESTAEHRVGDRSGIVFPAARASGGKVLLSQLHRDTLGRMYRSPGPGGRAPLLPEDRFEALLRELDTVRIRGYGTNEADTEDRVSSLSMPVLNAERIAVAAFGISVPAFLSRELTDRRTLEHLAAVRDEIAEDVAEHLPAWVSSPWQPQSP